MEIADYCRDIETYLCRKNDGHLIRVVGPSFELVSRWAEQGVPLKVAFEGIDRCFERYYRKGPRRRPVKIDFCEADVLDVFDEWRRATGVPAGGRPERARRVEGARPERAKRVEEARPERAKRVEGSLPAHLERVLLRLSSARAGGTLDAGFDPIVDRVAAELDAARAAPGGVRGSARESLLARLRDIDADLIAAARQLLDAGTLADLAHEADAELAGFRAAMSEPAYGRARAAAIDQLVRARFHLPTVAF